MIAERMIVKAKENRLEELVKLILSELVAQKERGNYSRPFRAYTPKYAGQRSNTAIFEWEWEDLAERDRVWAQWWQLPTTPAYGEKWNELAEDGAIHEIWYLRKP